MKPMHIIFKILALAISLFSFATIATANDSGAKLVGGGLVLQKLENIAMVSENLYISEDKIIVDYVFENTSNHDITTIVAFPLPPHPVEPYSDTGAGVTAAPDAIADNFVNFKTFVDGKRVKTQYKKEQKIGFAEVEDQEIFQITYYWQQNFPKGKKIKIRHEYRPMTGSGIPRTPNEFEEMVTNEYCPDNGFRAAIAKMRKQNEWAGWRDIGYILKTGGNWAGGTIGDFRLVVDKGAPDALVTFCGKNVKKISPTQFEMKAKNYKPKNDLYIFIIKDREKSPF
ncbi:DUF4424 domain-containing protein [Bartonella sp. HY329]|uniref:DUF4424 domain-containing protein n=1 Tax=unclassified Bartonella TaxID=2645622 RepID=UPI0021C7C247|nr:MULTISPECIES: DUF4424 domain-containing protein [unclassified Bartonella]UXM95044.1 DUF4424 domain-containing protein [Bartonella sp. HY329]UXN09367.1 DUF4424 domain-containing protein [Bartonella sp. HY328]